MLYVKCGNKIVRQDKTLNKYTYKMDTVETKQEPEWMRWQTCYTCGGMKNYSGQMFIICKCDEKQN